MNFDDDIIEQKEKKWKVSDLYNTLLELGIKQGDVLCVHSQIFSFGRILMDKQKFLDTIIEIFQEILGPTGTLIMPTFTYSFCNNTDYEKKISESKVGLLTEHFRKAQNVVRTNHPIFSFAIWGKRKDEFLDTGPDAFGFDSIYGKMINNQGKILMLGANKGYTFYYLAEEHLNVGHRYFKNFSGRIIDEEGKVKTANIPYFVRDISLKSDLDEEKLAHFLLENNLQKQIKFGKGTIGLFECKPTYETIVKELEKDERRFL